MKGNLTSIIVLYVSVAGRLDENVAIKVDDITVRNTFLQALEMKEEILEAERRYRSSMTNLVKVL